MDATKTKAEHLTEHVGDYLDTFYKFTMLNITQKTTGIVSISITSVIILFVGMCVLFFSGMGIGWWLGETWHNMLAGYLCVAGVYLVIMILAIILRKKTILPLVRNFIIRKTYE